MKKILLIGLLLNICFAAFAGDSTKVYMHKKEFRMKQQEFITKRADLSSQEASSFFPLFFEMKDKMAEVSGKGWKMAQKMKKNEMSDRDYEKLLDEFLSAKEKKAKIEKEYYGKFHKILSGEKLYKVWKADMNYHRFLLRGFGRSKGMRGKRVQMMRRQPRICPYGELKGCLRDSAIGRI